VNRLSVSGAGLVLVLFVLTNVMYDGFPLTHVTRPDPTSGSLPERMGRRGKVVSLSLSPESSRWDTRALAVNVIVGAELIVGAALAGALIERRARRAELQAAALPRGES
jgi:hypothetical protein